MTQCPSQSIESTMPKRNGPNAMMIIGHRYKIIHRFRKKNLKVNLAYNVAILCDKQEMPAGFCTKFPTDCF